MADINLLMCRADSLPMAVRDYGPEFTAQRETVAMPVIILERTDDRITAAAAVFSDGPGTVRRR